MVYKWCKYLIRSGVSYVNEFERKGTPTRQSYVTHGISNQGVVVRWRSHMYAIFSNWLNYMYIK